MSDLNASDFYLPYDTALVPTAKELRKNMTTAEKKLWYGYLRNFKFKVLRQRPIDHFIVDFYCPTLKLGLAEKVHSRLNWQRDRQLSHRLNRIHRDGHKRD